MTFNALGAEAGLELLDLQFKYIIIKGNDQACPAESVRLEYLARLREC
jgi:hypothetical protein